MEFLGRVSSEELVAAYRRAACFVLPATLDERADTEGLGVVLLEAMSYGVPVVATRMGGIVDLVTDQVNGLLYDASSPAALAAALRQLIDDPDRVSVLGSAAPPVKTVEQDAREWDSLYERLQRRPEAGAE